MDFKRVKWIVGAGILIGMAVCTLPIKRNIDKTIPTVQWQINDETTAKNLNVSIKGSYKNYLFRENSFKGDIQIEGYECTYKSEPLNITFHSGEGTLVYRHYNPEENNVENLIQMNQLGFLVCSPDFTELLIGVYLPSDSDNKSWDSDSGTVISGNAKELLKAKEIAARLFEKDDFMLGDNPFIK